MRAIALYREEFTPSEQLSHPYVMLGYNICAADTEAEAWHLRTSGLRALLNLRIGKPGPLPAPIDNFEATLRRRASNSGPIRCGCRCRQRCRFGSKLALSSQKLRPTN